MSELFFFFLLCPQTCGPLWSHECGSSLYSTGICSRVSRNFRLSHTIAPALQSNLSIHSQTHSFIHPSIHLYIHLSKSLSIYHTVHPSIIHPSTHSFVHSSIHPSAINPSVHPIQPSILLSLHLISIHPYSYHSIMH